VERVHVSVDWPGAQNGEGGTGSSARASPELGRRRGDRATAVARRGHGNSVGRGSSAKSSRPGSGDAGSGGAESSRLGSAGTVGKTELTSGARLSEKRSGGGRLRKA
jgi:hypothetical protein